MVKAAFGVLVWNSEPHRIERENIVFVLHHVPVLFAGELQEAFRNHTSVRNEQVRKMEVSRWELQDISFLNIMQELEQLYLDALNTVEHVRGENSALRSQLEATVSSVPARVAPSAYQSCVTASSGE